MTVLLNRMQLTQYQIQTVSNRGNITSPVSDTDSIERKTKQWKSKP